MEHLLFSREQWHKEAEAVIKDIRSGVQEAKIANSPRSSDSSTYINITTFENNKYCIELSGRGFRVVGRDYDCDTQPETTWYETPYALMNHLSSAFHEHFGKCLIAKLQAMQTVRTGQNYRRFNEQIDE